MNMSSRSRRRRRHLIPVVALAAVGAAGGAVVVAGCGDSASAVSAPASIAGYIPAQSPLYVQVSTDTDGPQWTNLMRLGALFPGFGSMRAEVDRVLAREGVDWERDLAPLLGESAAVAATGVPDAGSPGGPSATAATAHDLSIVVVVQIAPGRADDVKALITKAPGGLTAAGTRDGATLYTDSTAGMNAAVTDESLIIGSGAAVVTQALEAHAAGGNATLAGVVRFNEALALLPEDVFALAYVNLDVVGGAAREVVPQIAPLADGQMTGAAAVSVTAEPDGLRMKAVLVDAPPILTQHEFVPALTARAPADTVAYVGFNRLADTVQAALATASSRASGETKKQVEVITDQLPRLLGVNAADLRNLAGGEHALVVGGTGPSPRVVLALDVADGAGAAKSLAALTRSVPAVIRTFGSGAVTVGAVTDFPPGAVTGQVLTLGAGRSIAWGVRGDLAGIGNGAAAVTSVLAPRAAGDSLAGNATFRAATEGMPAKVTGLAYVDMTRVVSMLAARGAFDGGKDAITRADLEPIRTIAAWSTGGDTPTVEVVVGLGR